MAENSAFIDDQGLIHQIYFGDQDANSVAAMAERTVALAKKLQMNKRPPRILTDIRNVKHQNLGARREAMKALQTLEFYRIALIGGSDYLRRVANLIIAATGQGDRIRHFGSEVQAKEWLNT